MRSRIHATLLLAALTTRPGRAEAPLVASAAADFSGAGTIETATARAGGKSVRLEITSASGKRIAKADAPSPGRGVEVLLSVGSLRSSGALLEVSASAGGKICRSVWRLRDGALARLPIRDGSGEVADCETAGEWRSRWESAEGEPARYVRERTRDATQGVLVETRVFVFAGFALDPDPGRSVARINGIEIPEWPDAMLYRKSDLEALNRRFGLEVLRQSPRVRFETSRQAGVFAVRLTGAAGDALLPVTGSKSLEGDEPGVELSAGDPPVAVRVFLARGAIPWEAVVRGAGAARDGAYAPAAHRSFERIQVFRDAEHELAAEALPGVWAGPTGQRMAVEAIPGTADIRLGGAEAALSLALAPEGADLLLVPRDGSLPRWALVLRGPNALSRLPVLCGQARSDGPDCRISGAGEAWRRAGSQLNVR